MQHIKRVITTLAPALRLPVVEQVPQFPASLLTALAQVESQCGLLNIPRYESSWWTRLTDQARQGPPHKYSRFAPWIDLYGKQVACSWGPWQIMAFNAYDRGYRGRPDMLSIPEVAAHWTIRFFNSLPLAGKLDPATMHLYHPKDAPPTANSVDLHKLHHIRYADRLAVVAIVGDAWNTGNSADDMVPHSYIQKLLSAYIREEEDGYHE